VRHHTARADTCATNAATFARMRDAARDRGDHHGATVLARNASASWVNATLHLDAARREEGDL
jgi:hypothetical protein